MKLTIEVEIPDRDAQAMLGWSIERVLNNAINIGTLAQTRLERSIDCNDASTLWQDAEEIKPLTVRIWGATQEAIRRHYANTKA